MASLFAAWKDEARESVGRKQLASQLKMQGAESAMKAAMKLIGSKASALLRGAWTGWMEDYRSAREAKRFQSSIGHLDAKRSAQMERMVANWNNKDSPMLLVQALRGWRK